MPPSPFWSSPSPNTCHWSASSSFLAWPAALTLLVWVGPLRRHPFVTELIMSGCVLKAQVDTLIRELVREITSHPPTSPEYSLRRFQLSTNFWDWRNKQSNFFCDMFFPLSFFLARFFFSLLHHSQCSVIAAEPFMFRQNTFEKVLKRSKIFFLNVLF